MILQQFYCKVCGRIGFKSKASWALHHARHFRKAKQPTTYCVEGFHRICEYMQENFPNLYDGCDCPHHTQRTFWFYEDALEYTRQNGHSCEHCPAILPSKHGLAVHTGRLHKDVS